MMLRRKAVFSLAFLLCFELLWPQLPPVLFAQSRRPPERLRGVLSIAKLSPALHPSATIRYSPDGKAIVVQDSSGFMLFSRDPFKLITYVDAPYSYSVRFSADSQFLTLVTYDLFLSRWRVSNGQKLNIPNLVIPGGCLSATLSPNGDLFACYTPEMELTIFRIDDSKKLFSASVHSLPSGFGFYPIPFDSTTDYSSPFGYFLSNDTKHLANRGIFRFPLWFSPDSKFLIAGDDASSLRINLSSFAKETFASPLRKQMRAIAGLAQNDRVLLWDPLKTDPPSIASFSSGQTLSTLPFQVDWAELCSNSRFGLFKKESEVGIQLYDLYSNTQIPVVESISADVYANEVAALNNDDIVVFYNLGSSKPVSAVRLPLTNLPPLRAAQVDSALATLSVSVAGSGSTFDVASGKSLLTQKPFSGSNLADPLRPLFLIPRKNKAPHQILLGDLEKHSSAPAWSAEQDIDLRPGEAAFLEYSFYGEIRHSLLLANDNSGVAFKLRGLNPANGVQLWHAKYVNEVPIPFCDPQGNRFVIGWKAKAEGAKNAVKSNPAIRDAYKQSKRMQQDSVFEVFDSITGKSLGGVYVQFGDGPINFSSVFSVGDFLFLVKDNVRISVLALRDGKLVTHAKGYRPAANGQSNLMALDEGLGRLGVYDLLTGTRIEQQQFPDYLAYMHFSADGEKLLVLTQHQVVYVLDMSEVREHPLAPLHQTQESSDPQTDQPQ